MKSIASAFLIVVALASAACGPAFTAGEADEAIAGAAGTSVAMGNAGAAGDAAAGVAGTAGGAGAGAGGETAGSAGLAETAGMPAEPAPPCDDAVTVYGGYHAADAARCLRTEEIFDTITCTNWGSTIIRVNGLQVACNQQGVFPPAIGGFNYFELVGQASPSGQLRWLTLAPIVPCKNPVTLTSTTHSVALDANAICLRTSSELNTVGGIGMEDRTLRINGVPVPNNTQVGFPPSTDGYNYIEVSAGALENARLSWSFVRIAQG